MGKPFSDLETRPQRKSERVFMLAALILLPLSLTFALIGTILGGILLILLLIDVIILVSFTRKYINWTFVFLLMILEAIIFRSQRWPMTGIWFTLGFTGLAIISLFSSGLFLKRYNHNKFLKYIGFSSSIILTIISIGLLFKNMHWPLGSLLLSVGVILFIPFLFAFIFILPGSNYINWSKAEREIFFKSIIIPMTFVYILCVLMIVLPDFWRSLTRLPLSPFGMY